MNFRFTTSHVTKIWKTFFPKEFFDKIWLKVGKREYIYISEIKFDRIILLKNESQNFFVT